eukprot:c13577_g1_i2.p1 GENE.c13577_g1_i2~~c13577_g1_i2.p1  ORF type:complete len:271 (+),score=17.11 c13577_g1_i2:20-832(+)
MAQPKCLFVESSTTRTPICLVCQGNCPSARSPCVETNHASCLIEAAFSSSDPSDSANLARKVPSTQNQLLESPTGHLVRGGQSGSSSGSLSPGLANFRGHLYGTAEPSADLHSRDHENVQSTTTMDFPVYPQCLDHEMYPNSLSSDVGRRIIAWPSTVPKRDVHTVQPDSDKAQNEKIDPRSIYKYCCEFQPCCGKFKTKYELQMHTRVHTNERPYLCTFSGCNKRFIQSGGLVRHVRTHTGERPFACQLCNRRFTESGHLLRHAKTHKT